MIVGEGFGHAINIVLLEFCTEERVALTSGLMIKYCTLHLVKRTKKQVYSGRREMCCSFRR